MKYLAKAATAQLDVTKHIPAKKEMKHYFAFTI